MIRPASGHLFCVVIELRNDRLIRWLTEYSDSMKSIMCCCAFLIALMIGISPSTAAAQENPGKQLYLRYCSSCHGAAGKGGGAVSRDLKIESA
jgi:cytochrome c553